MRGKNHVFKGYVVVRREEELVEPEGSIISIAGIYVRVRIAMR
jgi:hypothetical protein